VRRLAVVASFVAACGSAGRDAGAQGTPVACDAVPIASSSDSVPLRAVIRIHAVDRARDLPTWYQTRIGEAVGSALVVPSHLGMSVYEVSPDTTAGRIAHLAISGAYRATLMRDGHLVDAEVTGGARNATFDAEIIAALKSLAVGNALPPLASAGFDDASVPLRIGVATRGPGDRPSALGLSEVIVSTIPSTTPRSARADVDSEVVVTLFAFQAPSRRVTVIPRQIPGYGNLRYPSGPRGDALEGQVAASFVVGVDGRVEKGSFQTLGATRSEFAQSVLDASPSFRFVPLAIDGCVARWVVDQPFFFRLR
jgi:TonB family protein